MTIQNTIDMNAFGVSRHYSGKNKIYEVMAIIFCKIESSFENANYEAYVLREHADNKKVWYRIAYEDVFPVSNTEVFQ